MASNPLLSGKKSKIRLACTVVLLRDGPGRLEVLVLRRAQTAAFLGGAYVFPGGAVDDGDSDGRVLARMRGLSDSQCSAQLSTSRDALRFWATAVRECFEESGVLIARDTSGALLKPNRMAMLADARRALHAGTLTFADFLDHEGLFIHTDDFVYVDHWITPAGRPRRFDTRFFWARTPPEHRESADELETVELEWVAPTQALARADAGTIQLPFATRHMLRDLARWVTVTDALENARSRGPIETKRPVVAQGARGPIVFRNGDAAYAEIHWTDPEETASTTYDLVPSTPKRLDRFVTRVIAPNPSIMTGPGTNTYLVGGGELAVIDPGPAIDAHIDAVLAAGESRIRWILCTHSHRDHSPAATKLKSLTGAHIIGAAAPIDGRQDPTFYPDTLAMDGARYALGDVTLLALHTPGHASNHFCYLLENTGMLFSGDHVMQGSTVIINPPDGDMSAYLSSLGALLTRDVAIIAPGHGYLIGKPHEEIRRLIAHRQQRESLVLQALARVDKATVQELVLEVYADVPVERHGAAARSLLAHLLKLVADGVVREVDGVYALAPT